MNFLCKKLVGLKSEFFPSVAERALVQKRVDFYGRFVSPNDLCFDVGANMGNRVAALLRLKTRVVAVEPQKKCCRVLKRVYGGVNLVIEQVGLGESESAMDLYIADTSVFSSFSRDWIRIATENNWPIKWDKTERVKITTLDALIQKHGLPQFIKIDVEGFGLEVLKGLSSSVNLLSVEYVTPELTQNTVDCIKRIVAIDGDVLFNYSVGENMEFVLRDWITADQLIEVVYSKDFEKTGGGDIYACNQRFIKVLLQSNLANS
jgi:FkbM family methyltransferase